ncbi:Predicted arabinose efflux permease, MFS family [Streptomyces qinglanensis]|uniref:Predicted arabinose efflux permease, MFS family n=1 Tax=Streptomyces qinglanensis TaxID=943816 RepID=A0A1H9SXE4_9ACTN|nr:MFS transporter [Streptomyces qinglanensis]SER89089.1 Predicted arabinose efflux permease, MFS family [Streptomyces qinglanensis]
MAAGYAELLRARHAMRLLTGTLVGRLPNATGPIALALFVRAEGGSMALAGALSAGYGLATAFGQPMLGRLVDLFGQPRVMLPAAAASAAGAGTLALAGIGSLPLALVCVLAFGLFTPPLEGGLRALWPSVLRREEQVHTAYALDAVAQEVMFAVGPLLVTLLVAGWSEAAALLVVNGLGLLGAVSVVVSPPSRRWRSAPRKPHWLGALRSPGLKVLLASFFFVGLALGTFALAAVSYADDHSDKLLSTCLLAAQGTGALVGGISYGARAWPGSHEGRLRVLVGLFALGNLPLALVPGVPVMVVLGALSGLFLAPSLACAFVVVDRHAPAGTVTEAFSWLVTTFGVGAAAGTAAVGPLIERGGTGTGFALAGAGGVAAVAVVVAARRFLAPPDGASSAGAVASGGAPAASAAAQPAGAPAAPAPLGADTHSGARTGEPRTAGLPPERLPGAETDRNGCGEPGFRSFPQA